MFDQTWWNNNLKNRYNEYLKWLGDESSESRIFIKQYIKDNNIKSMVDFGCGPAVEYYNLKKDDYEIEYLGIDSCIHIRDIHNKDNMPFLFSNVDSDIDIKNDSYELSYSRHVLEHLPEYKTMLSNMIRISKKYIVNIFFIKPSDKEAINFDKHDNLYHNRYCKKDIEQFLQNLNINDFKWIEINNNECALVIQK